MSLLRRSTGRGGELFADELPLTEFRPMTSHARMEGTHARATSSRVSDLQDHKSPRQRGRKAFLPQLSQTKTFVLNTHRDTAARHQQRDADDDDASNTNNVDVDTDAFRQAMWAGQANILVTVRLRPHLGHDRDNEEIVKVLDHKLVVVLDAANGAEVASGSSGHQPPVRRHTSHPIRQIRNATVSAAPRRSREKRFAFDHVFTPEDGQQTVYCHTTKFLIHGVLNGFNATVFAYGCTGAGKTYTMLGTPDQPGIMALTLEDLFQNITRVHDDPLANVTYKVTVSFLEVYNENIRDLLVNQSSSTLPGNGNANEFLDVREDPIKGSIIAGISEIEACNALEVMKLLRKGNKHRSQEATAANAVSSRSHAVLQVLVEQRERTISASSTLNESLSSGEDGSAVTTVVKFGKLSLVDLAGSERAAVTQNRGQRLLEGANINRSLLALGNCINALGEKGASAASFVPYRDSKLTRLLKDSLGGNCRTVMIANISLAAASHEETLNTLKYANRAKNIKTTVTRNVLNVDHHITEYVGVISGLRDEITALKKQLVRQQQDVNDDGGVSSLAIQRSIKTHQSNNNNADDEDESTNSAEAPPSAAAIQKQLQDVRQHVTRYFAERLRLREALLKVDYQIGVLVENPEQVMSLGGHEQRTERDTSENSKPEGTSRPEIEGPTSERNQDDVAISTAAGSPKRESLPPHANGDSVERLVSEKALDELEALTQRKQEVLQELSRLETRMEAFRSAILSSSSLMDHAMVKEILLMEFRVGNLEIEKMELQLTKDLQDLEIGSLRMRIGAQPRASILGGNGREMIDSEQSDRFKLPLLSQPLLKFSSAQPPNSTSAPHPLGGDETLSQRGSPPPRSSHGFMDDLRDRFHALKSSHEDRDQSQQRQMVDKQTKSAVSSSASGTATISSSRKQWGISLTSTTLPYIRLKKKTTSSDNLSSLETGGLPHQSPVTGVSGLSSPSVTAPYLRVLKHRRKSHQGSKKSTSFSAHRK